MWTLEATPASEAGGVHRILPGTSRTLGRAPGAHFVVDAPLVSRVHCRLTATPDGPLEVEDLGSTNGTFVNGTRVQQASLTDGDVLRVGRAELLVRKA